MKTRIGTPSINIAGKSYNLFWGDQHLVVVNGDGYRHKVYNGRLASALGRETLESVLERELRISK